VRTLVVSDLHLGAASGKDLARRAELRAPLIEALRDADRLVVLGDGLELREAPHRAAAELAAPFLAEAGAALGPGGELLIGTCADPRVRRRAVAVLLEALDQAAKAAAQHAARTGTAQ